MQNFKKLTFSFAFLFLIFTQVKALGAEGLSDLPQSIPIVDGIVPIYGTVIEGKTPGVVAREILEAIPHAIVLTPEEDAPLIADPPAQAMAGTTTEMTSETAIEVTKDAKTNTASGSQAIRIIKSQQANALNTDLLYMDFGYENVFYILSPKYRLYQAGSMLVLNYFYLNHMNRKLGRWTRIMQWGGHNVANGAVKLRIVKQEKWQKRAEVFGNFLTHGFLNYAYYSLLQLMSNLPNFHEGMFSWKAQENDFKKAGSSFLSGFGWTMLGRRWDELPDSERPISRQAYSAFNTIRGAMLGIFVPFLVSTPTNATLADFLIRNSPFFISAGLGASAYFWADPILSRYPQVGRSLERFDKFTRRLNDRLTIVHQKVTDRLQPYQSRLKLFENKCREILKSFNFSKKGSAGELSS